MKNEKCRRWRHFLLPLRELAQEVSCLAEKRREAKIDFYTDRPLILLGSRVTIIPKYAGFRQRLGGYSYGL